MNIIPWRSKHRIPVAREMAAPAGITEFRRELDRLFDRAFRGSWLEPWEWPQWAAGPVSEIVPSTDVSESDKEITIRAEVPGLGPEDIEITVSGNTLTIHGEKRESSEEKRDDYYHCERRFGAFTRAVELPGSADLDKIEAEQRNGVLTVRVKKVPAAQAKKIAVKPAKAAAPARQMAGATT